MHILMFFLVSLPAKQHRTWEFAQNLVGAEFLHADNGAMLAIRLEAGVEVGLVLGLGGPPVISRVP